MKFLIIYIKLYYTLLQFAVIKYVIIFTIKICTETYGYSKNKKTDNKYIEKYCLKACLYLNGAANELVNYTPIISSIMAFNIL